MLSFVAWLSPRCSVLVCRAALCAVLCSAQRDGDEGGGGGDRAAHSGGRGGAPRQQPDTASHAAQRCARGPLHQRLNADSTDVPVACAWFRHCDHSVKLVCARRGALCVVWERRGMSKSNADEQAASRLYRACDRAHSSNRSRHSIAPIAAAVLRARCTAGHGDRASCTAGPHSATEQHRGAQRTTSRETQRRTQCAEEREAWAADSQPRSAQQHRTVADRHRKRVQSEQPIA